MILFKTRLTLAFNIAVSLERARRRSLANRQNFTGAMFVVDSFIKAERNIAFKSDRLELVSLACGKTSRPIQAWTLSIRGFVYLAFTNE